MLYPIVLQNFFRGCTYVFFLQLFSTGLIQGQTDDFDDGNDEGWVRTDPLAEANIKTATYDFPDGAYRIQQPPSPSEELGQARAGAFREELYENLDKLHTPLAVVEVFDDIHAMGHAGIFASAGPSDGPIDVTFDNYMAIKPVVPALPLFEAYNARIENGNLIFNFEIEEGENYGFEGSANLEDWDAEENATFSKEGVEGKIEVDINNSSFRYFRITR